MKPFSTGLGRTVKCRRCGERHVQRMRKPGTCLMCDILARTDAGQTVAGIAVAFDLPAFLIDEVLASLLWG